MSIKQKASMGLTATAQSFGFFGSYKWLALFPIISFLISLSFIAVVALSVFEVSISTNFFGLGADLTQATTSVEQSNGSGPESLPLVSIAGIAVLFLLSFCMYTISTFFNVALSACVLAIFEDKPIGIGGGISTAAHRLKAIFGWSAISAVLGTISSVIDRRGNILISVLTFLAGLAWSVATLFVIPIVATRNVNAVTAIKDSVKLMGDDWGESNAAHRGSRKRLFIFIGVLIGVTLLTHINLGPQMSTDVSFALLPFLVIFMLFFSTLYTISRTALFYYATRHEAPPQFDSDTLRNAIAARRSRR